METERLLIRPFSPDDHTDLYEYLSQEEVVRYEPYGVCTAEQSRQEATRRAGDFSFWAVCLKDSDKLIGNIYLSPQDFGSWLLGYVFNARFHGRGYATEAVRALLDDVFGQWRARRVIAMCNPINTPSWRLLERLGFRREGCLIQNVYLKTDTSGNPIWTDTYEYAILADEWQSREAR